MTQPAHSPSASGAQARGSTAPPQRARRITVEGETVLHVLGRFGLLMLLFLVLAVFSIWKPDTFFTWTNFKATFSSEAVILMVALGVMVPLVVGEFDLSVGANAGLAAIFTVGFCDMQHIEPLAGDRVRRAHLRVGWANQRPRRHPSQGQLVRCHSRHGDGDRRVR